MSNGVVRPLWCQCRTLLIFAMQTLGAAIGEVGGEGATPYLFTALLTLFMKELENHPKIIVGELERAQVFKTPLYEMSFPQIAFPQKPLQQLCNVPIYIVEAYFHVLVAHYYG